MHDAKFGESTIFSDVAKKLKWLKTPWRESMVKYFPKWLTLFMFFVFIEPTHKLKNDKSIGI